MGYHIYNLQALYDAIYGRNNQGARYEIQSLKEADYYNMLSKNGNITILFGEEGNVIIAPVYIPNSINKYQLKELENFNENIKEIVAESPEYFKIKPVIFFAGNDPSGCGEDIKSINNIDIIIEIARERLSE